VAACPALFAIVRVKPRMWLVEHSLTRTTKGMITIFGDHALDLRFCVVAGAGFEPATSGLCDWRVARGSDVRGRWWTVFVQVTALGSSIGVRSGPGRFAARCLHFACRARVEAEVAMTPGRGLEGLPQVVVGGPVRGVAARWALDLGRDVGDQIAPRQHTPQEQGGLRWLRVRTAVAGRVSAAQMFFGSSAYASP